MVGRPQDDGERDGKGGSGEGAALWVVGDGGWLGQGGGVQPRLVSVARAGEAADPVTRKSLGITRGRGAGDEGQWRRQPISATQEVIGDLALGTE